MNTKVYNILFPLWFLIIFPITWIVILPVNFIIDSLVVLISLRILKVCDIKKIYIKTIIRVWLLGFASDIIGALLLLISQADLGRWWQEYIVIPVAYNPFDNVYALGYVSIAVVVAGVCIYLFNRYIAFKDIDLLDKYKKKIALALAIFTAPYVLLIPSALMYAKGEQVGYFTNHIISGRIPSLTLEGRGISKALGRVDIPDYRNDEPCKYVLVEAINKADKIKKPVKVQGEADYKLRTNGGEEPVEILFWVEHHKEEPIFNYEGNWYKIEKNFNYEGYSGTVAEILTELAH